MRWGKPPGHMLGRAGERWTHEDRVAALAYELYLSLLCKECGQPIDKCRDANSDGYYDVESETCYARKAVEEHRGQPGYKAAPGEILYPVMRDQDEETTHYGARPW